MRSAAVQRFLSVSRLSVCLLKINFNYINSIVGLAFHRQCNAKTVSSASPVQLYEKKKLTFLCFFSEINNWSKCTGYAIVSTISWPRKILIKTTQFRFFCNSAAVYKTYSRSDVSIPKLAYSLCLCACLNMFVKCRHTVIIIRPY